MAIEDFETSQGELGGLTSLVNDLIGDKKGAEDAAAQAAAAAEAEAQRLAAEAAEAAKGGNEGNEGNNDVIDLSDEEKTEILKDLGGSKFDDKGNVIDDKGEVLFTADELTEALEASNKETKETIIDKAVKLSGFELKDEKGETLKFENSEKGIVELATKLGSKIAEQEQEKVYNTFPVVKDLVKHLITGGKVEEFFNSNELKYSNTTLTDETTQDTYLNLIKDKYMKVNNMSAEEAQAIVNFHKDAETWKEEGKKALTALSGLEVQTKQQKEAAYQASIKAQQENNVKFWMDRKAVIEKGALVNNITIPVKERGEFFDYIAKPIDARGMSQYQIDAAGNSLESELFYSYLRFKKADFKSLVQSESANDKVARIKEALAKRTKSNGQQSRASNMKKVAAGNADNFPSINQVVSVQ